MSMSEAILRHWPGIGFYIRGNEDESEQYENIVWEHPDNAPTTQEVADAVAAYQNEYLPRKTFISNRTIAVSMITVTTTNGHVFDGDEISQGRMPRAILSMTDAETVQWVLANNNVIQVTKSELQEALRLAGEEQTRLWVMP